MTKFHLILSVLELVVILLFGVCVFVSREKTWNLYTRFFCALSITIINIIQLILEVRLEQSFVLSVIMILLWGMDIFVYGEEIRKNKFKKKKFSLL